MMSDQANTRVYIVAHKDFDAPVEPGYVPILAGAARNHANIAIRDDAGENISVKNPQFCELTAQYWVWRNACADSANVGFVHYRRYFYTDVRKSRIVPAAQFAHDLTEVDVVLPEPWVLTKTIRAQFAQFHNIDDLNTVRAILQEKHPEYVQAFDELLDGHALYSYNMFVMDTNRFSAYMEWLFDVLDEAERRIDTTGYDTYNQRLFGFLAERLLNVWVRTRKLRVKTYPVYKPDDVWWKEALRAQTKKLLYGRNR
ncbi:glycosyl transferase [Bifidobacterium pseudolongum subsp. globosum]|uniref:DUF4422 domain-containing protein n=1 Tax=Bifidobacterium pseudolongum TaxID=1694 RepID=UPI0010DB4665|nr:DUF4422 domain-containing protein [Bifidobacterium pseudolongum]RYP99390.1 glycosyl transferase [Bifidobacterium pseudolongum subsp. globosum]RYQ11523.1 glycosyl transferase [Bifidobacterium pseudolongum subsp. globosum]RYQ58370.1 glycosyl transferase [Bifidobacterium pseudolongum subsp. globosum]